MSMIRSITPNPYRILTSNAIISQMSPVHMTPTVPIIDKIATNVSRETDPETYLCWCIKPSKRQFSSDLVAETAGHRTKTCTAAFPLVSRETTGGANETFLSCAGHRCS